jgi:mannose-6-phosphate isomerase-like protein (cupin superfamily)
MRLISIACALITMLLLTAAAQSPAVTYLDHQKVAEALAQGKSLMTAPNLSVSGAQRTGPGQAEIHDKETDVLYITDGSATFVTGGTMVGGKQTAPGQHRGTDIQGGQVHHLTKGDVVVVQAGTPHWFKEVPQAVHYFVVKAIRE